MQWRWKVAAAVCAAAVFLVAWWVFFLWIVGTGSGAGTGVGVDYSYGLGNAGVSLPAHVYVIRHADKDDSSGYDLSSKGQQRAQLLAAWGAARNVTALYTPGPTLKGRSRRAQQTGLPLAAQGKVPMYGGLRRDAVARAAQEILGNAEWEATASVLVVWVSEFLADLVRELGERGGGGSAAALPAWPSENYATVVHFDFTRGPLRMTLE